MVALSGAPTDGAAADDSFLLLLNAWWEPLPVVLPGFAQGMVWGVEIDTTDPSAGREDDERHVDPAAGLTLGPRSLVLLRGGPASG